MHFRATGAGAFAPTPLQEPLAAAFERRTAGVRIPKLESGMDHLAVAAAAFERAVESSIPDLRVQGGLSCGPGLLHPESGLGAAFLPSHRRSRGQLLGGPGA